VLAISLLALDYVLVSPLFYGEYFFGKVTILLYWFLQMAFLSGSRVAYRHFRYVRTQHHAREGVPTLVLGRAADAEVLLRAIESGAVSKVKPSAFSHPRSPIADRPVRGIPVVGGLDDLEQIVKECARAGCARRAADLPASALGGRSRCPKRS
jgi:O-antigen biosynthesis protein WbqV